MRKPLISLSLLIMALQACSGKPAGFQGDSASVAGGTGVEDAAARNYGNRDSGSEDATAMPGDADGSLDTSNDNSIEIDSIEMDDSIIYEGVDATISVPSDSSTGSDNSTGTAGSGSTTPTDNNTSGSNSSSSTTPPGNAAPAPAPAPLTLTISVPSTSLRAGSSPMQATAKLSGQMAPANVTWSVKSAAGQNAGSIDETGLYTAPASGGGYDITISAALSDDPTITASVVVRIVVAAQIFVGCQQGSEFFPITADVYELPVNTNKLPDFSNLTKLTKVCMDQYNVAPRDWSTGFPGVPGLFEWFGLRTTTRLIAPATGTYTFKLNSDDGAKLYINGNLVIDNDGQHAPTAKEASITLTAGEHALSIDYFQGPRYQIALELYWKMPGSTTYVYVPKASFK